MSRDEVSYYFLAEALAMPLFSGLSTLQTIFFWWSYPLIFLGRAVYGQAIIDEYGVDTYLNILFSIQRYHIFLDFFFYNTVL